MEEFENLQNLVTEVSWSNMIPEILEIILENCDKTSLLRCRQLNFHWKSNADSFLEKKILKQWKQWDPFSPSGTPHVTFLTTYLYVPYQQHQPCWKSLACPQNYSSTRLHSPFPANSLKIDLQNNSNSFSQNHQRSLDKEQAQLLKNVVKYYGQHLSSLVLNNLDIFPETLKKVLKFTANLKALNISQISLQGRDNTVGDTVLPTDSTSVLQPLPKLDFVKIFSCSGKASQLLLHGYGHQLVSFETNMFIPGFVRGFEKLKKLKSTAIIKTDLQFPQLPSVPQELEHLSVSNLNSYPFPKLVEAIEKFPNTLIHLHLDIRITEYINFPAIKEHKLFNNLKTLAIPWPVYDEQAKTVATAFLPRFPNLERLNFLRCSVRDQYETLESDEEDDDHDQDDRRRMRVIENGDTHTMWDYRYKDGEKNKIGYLLGKENYWNVCSKLKIISVFRSGEKESQFHVAKREGVC